MGGFEDANLVVISKEDLETTIQKAAEVSATKAADLMLISCRKEEKKKIDRRLHNTRLLLRTYRELREFCSNAVYERTSLKAEDVMEDIMSMRGDHVIIESIKASAERTMLTVEHVDKMLNVYRICCSQSSPENRRRYKVIKAMFINKEEMKIGEISKKFSVDKSTIYKDVEIAVERLTPLFFGIDGFHFVY